MVVERRAEAMQAGDRAEPRASSCGVPASLITPVAAQRSRSRTSLSMCTLDRDEIQPSPNERPVIDIQSQ